MATTRSLPPAAALALRKRQTEAPATPTRQRNAAAPLRPTSPCACGGRCPRCNAGADDSLPVSRPGDPAERQADAVADQVAQGRSIRDLLPLPTQAVARHAHAAPKSPHALSGALSGPAQPLAGAPRQWATARIGRNFDHVRVHTDSGAAAAAQRLGADAVTVGSHVLFGAGRYQPDTPAGRRLLAHELVHTLQPQEAVYRSCRANADESFYASASNYCRDTGFTGMFHSDKTCYRQVPVRSSYWECPPGDQVCFDADGNCEDSWDEASPVESRDSDGACNLHHGCTWSYHTADDVVPGLAEKATAPVAEWLGGLDRSIRGLYGAW